MTRNKTTSEPGSITGKTVCGRMMTTDPAWYPQSEYHQERIFFCTEFCLDAYKADPEKFLLAHQEKHHDIKLPKT